METTTNVGPLTTVYEISGGRGRIRTSVARKERQIYSLLPLAARPPVLAVRPQYSHKKRDVLSGKLLEYRRPAPFATGSCPQLHWCEMSRLIPLALLLCTAIRAETVLVLPFFNQSKAANLDWIGESLSEAVGDALASEGLLVLDRSDRLEAYRRLSVRPGAELTHATVMKIGGALDAS